MSKTTSTLVGLAGLILLTWITVTTRQAAIEEDLVERVDLQLASHAIGNLEVSAEGRDLSLSGDLPPGTTPDYVAGLAGDVWGVRAVDVSGLSSTAGVAGAVAATEAADPLEPAFDTGRIKRLGGELSRPLSVEGCQRTLARLASVSDIQFPVGGASPLPASYPVLNDLATVLYQCPDARVVIGSHIDGSGERESELRLGEARAAAIARFFQLAGIDPARTEVVSYGDSQPLMAGDTPEGRAANRRITLDVLPRG